MNVPPVKSLSLSDMTSPRVPIKRSVVLPMNETPLMDALPPLSRSIPTALFSITPPVIVAVPPLMRMPVVGSLIVASVTSALAFAPLT